MNKTASRGAKQKLVATPKAFLELVQKFAGASDVHVRVSAPGLRFDHARPPPRGRKLSSLRLRLWWPRVVDFCPASVLLLSRL